MQRFLKTLDDLGRFRQSFKNSFLKSSINRILKRNCPLKTPKTFFFALHFQLKNI